MRRVRLIFLALVLALVGGNTIFADDGFYVIPAMKGKYAPVTQTGQKQSYTAGDDGNLQKGIPWPTPRFTDNNNGTVIDNLTGLIWMKNANAFSPRTWAQAISDANNLKSGDAGLTDGSKAGDWRLPNIRELHSLVDYSRSSGMALPAGHPFTEVHWDGPYWSSTTDEDPLAANSAWNIGFDLGGTGSQPKGNPSWVWCVRGGG